MQASPGPSYLLLGQLGVAEPSLTEDGESRILNRIKLLAAQHLPEGWKNWKVAITDKTSLFVDGIEPQVINKLRFALPTVGLAKAFNPEAKSLSEKTYREMKLRMLNWPFCIGLVIGPPALASKIRGAELKHELVMSSLESVKPLLVSRVEASRQLAEDTSDTESTSTNGTKAVRGKKEGRLDRLEQSQEELKMMMQSFLDRFAPPSEQADNSYN
nr:unnamed protein product [Callosobruchus analis]